MAPLLEITDLHVRFATRTGLVHAVRGVNLTIDEGEVTGIVGESGSGKSATMLAVLGLAAASARITGSIRFRGEELLGAPERLRTLRGGQIGTIFQDPLTSLNPVLRVGEQVAETIRIHQRVSASRAQRQAIGLLELVAIPDPARRSRAYPHELSGGMRQRVMIAMAIANDPKLLIADEPTTALDVTIQAQILDILADLRDRKGLAVALITHDLGVVAGLADSVSVMYTGHIVEQAAVDDAFHRPRHPYTRGLLTSLPRLDRRAADLRPIGGAPPSPGEDLPGCSYRPRCPLAVDTCEHEGPRLRPVGESDVACHRAELEVHWEYA